MVDVSTQRCVFAAARSQPKLPVDNRQFKGVYHAAVLLLRTAPR